MNNLSLIFILLVVYQFKHFMADFLLQGKYMLQKFKPDWGFFLPLLAHASVHALFTLIICLVVRPELWWLSLVDLIVHFIMDRIKAGPKYLGRYKALSATEYRNTVLDEHFNTLRDYTGDVEKARNAMKGNIFFWWSLGLDQMVHALTHYFIIWRLVS